MTGRSDIDRLFGPPQPGDPDFEPYDPVKQQAALAALARERAKAALPGSVLVNAADWDPPEPVPDGWLVVNAPRPLAGKLTWTGDFRHGTFYAAAGEIPEGYFGWASDDAWLVELITNADIEERVMSKLANYGYASLEDAGVTMAEIAASMELPWHQDRPS